MKSRKSFLLILGIATVVALVFLLMNFRGERNVPDKEINDEKSKQVSTKESERLSNSFAVDASIALVFDDILPAFYSNTQMDSLCPLYENEQEAIEMLLNKEVSLAFTTRRLTESEEGTLKQKKLNPRIYPLAYDAIAIIVNKANKDSVLTTEQFKKILKGEINNWKQIDSNSSYEAIRVVSENNSSGTYHFCTDSILRGEPINIGDNLVTVSSPTEVIEYVKQNKDAIGICNVLWLNDSKTKSSFINDVSIVAVGLAPMFAVKPHQYYIATGEYPFYCTIYAICTDPQNSGPMRRLVNFCWNPNEQGQLIFQNAGLFPARVNYVIREQ